MQQFHSTFNPFYHPLHVTQTIASISSLFSTVHELRLTIIKHINITTDHYLLATCQQQHQTERKPHVPTDEYQALLTQHSVKVNLSPETKVHRINSELVTVNVPVTTYGNKQDKK